MSLFGLRATAAVAYRDLWIPVTKSDETPWLDVTQSCFNTNFFIGCPPPYKDLVGHCPCIPHPLCMPLCWSTLAIARDHVFESPSWRGLFKKNGSRLTDQLSLKCRLWLILGSRSDRCDINHITLQVLIGCKNMGCHHMLNTPKA